MMLENFYKGDEHWKKFVSIFPTHESLQDNPVYEQLLKKLNMNKDLTVVIYELIGKEKCLSWINENNPALEGMKPIQCLEDSLLQRLRVMLMRL